MFLLFVFFFFFFFFLYFQFHDHRNLLGISADPSQERRVSQIQYHLYPPFIPPSTIYISISSDVKPVRKGTLRSAVYPVHECMRKLSTPFSHLVDSLNEKDIRSSRDAISAFCSDLMAFSKANCFSPVLRYA